LAAGRNFLLSSLVNKLNHVLNDLDKNLFDSVVVQTRRRLLRSFGL
jgi:hypothetical protein